VWDSKLGGKKVRWGVGHLKNGDGSKMKRGLLDSSRCRKEGSEGGDGRERRWVLVNRAVQIWIGGRRSSLILRVPFARHR